MPTVMPHPHASAHHRSPRERGGGLPRQLPCHARVAMLREVRGYSQLFLP